VNHVILLLHNYIYKYIYIYRPAFLYLKSRWTVRVLQDFCKNKKNKRKKPNKPSHACMHEFKHGVWSNCIPEVRRWQLIWWDQSEHRLADHARLHAEQIHTHVQVQAATNMLVICSWFYITCEPWENPEKFHDGINTWSPEERTEENTWMDPNGLLAVWTRNLGQYRTR
jgi:hypothetical protein